MPIMVPTADRFSEYANLPRKQRIAWRLLAAVWLDALGDKDLAEDHLHTACELAIGLRNWRGVAHGGGRA